MKQVMNSMQTYTQSKEKLAVIRLELDYELAVLYEAMEAKNTDQMEKSKEKLNILREQMLKMEA
ncbi:hypothetical protein ACP2W0_11470 [Pseudobacillus badius]|uniref:hypothetical protein n=1 Tax=Bacillus badius TaxID=1455 RepID=UPI0007B0BBB7|nr:hypothetical protein [Bacillus badius]KZO01538.1 hypothetical protein A4244_00180 [Bacillus badius]MED0667180.1 hypothetical protein [Bacillus badius]OCS89932.1 hypothetical protein A6M11_00180 [Bacillus badius]OVE53459.1 hypothetical protein B1A98_01235 [Bacillus badius]TDW05815.1 hypothetical protein B0G66_101245 [Bacillus badius]